MVDSTGELLVDTSVIVRYLVNDLHELAERATRVIEGPHTVVVSEVVLVETAHVLSRLYSIERERVVDVLVQLLQRRNVRLLQLPKALAIEAIQSCRNSKRFAFADVILWAQARHEINLPISTFDRRFPNAGVQLVVPT